VYPDRGDPKTDFTVQHQGIVFELRDGAPRARNRKHPDPTSGTITGVAEVPAATAAALMVAKETFDAVGGFTPGYVYGAEDVDLCLRLRPHGPIVVQRDAALFHHESASQTDDRGELRRTRERNWRLIAAIWGPTLTRSIRKDRVLGEGRWTTQQRPKVAITLTRDDPSFGFGDWYTAHELGDAFSARGWAVHYAERYGDHWDEIPSDVGLIISLLDSYDVRTAPPEAFTIAWVRNWVDRWLGRDWLDEYDLVVTGSHRAAAEFRDRSRFDPPVVPLATNPERFAPGKPARAHVADYSFTGNHWGLQRQIMASLLPRDGERFGLYGRAWDEVPEVAEDWRGFVGYDELPAVYRSAPVVLDDTAGPTIDHGFINSRVFDALAAGALVISNNPLGSEEIFDGLLPTYSTPAELRDLLDRFLSDDVARAELVERLRAIVLDHHTYPHRAAQFVELAVAEIDRPRIAIKIAAPTAGRAEFWGDTHFAQAITRALRSHGFRGEIHLHPEWDLATHQGVDVALQLRGHHVYDPKPSAINVMWLISHPDETTLEEFDRFDLVAVASTDMAEELATRTGARVVPMLQATDGERFGAATPQPELARDVLFVGNSRGQHRIAVDWAIESGLPLTMFGNLWDGIIPDGYVEATHFPNERLPDLYASAGVVLNDHWPDMRRRGFVSNRIFDVLAAGGFVVSDPVPGLDEMLDGAVPTFATREELVSVIEHYRDAPEERAALVERGRRIVLERHTFTHRAEELAALLRRLLQNRPADLDGTTF